MFNVVFNSCVSLPKLYMYNVQIVHVIFHSLMMKIVNTITPFPNLPEASKFFTCGLWLI